jgi:DNA-binding CsgD family transcriptional regulator
MIVDVESVRASAARAALNPALWPETLWRVGQLVGSDFTVFDHIDKRTGHITLGFCDRPDHVAEVREKYEQYFHRINPRFDIARRMSLDTVMHDDFIGDDKAISRSEFYTDFLKPYGLMYFIGSGVADDAEQSVVFSVQRNADRGRVSEAQKRDFGAILPDIRNAFAMYLRMLNAPCDATLAAAFDRMTDPLAVVRADGRLVFANLAMSGVLAAGDIVRLSDHALTGVGEGTARALGEAMRRALTGRRSALATAPAGATGSLIFRVAPLADEEGREFDPAATRLFCLLIDDPARPHWPSVEDAMRLFALTRREATVGIHLAAGLSPDEIARRLCVSRNTVRSHLAMLREKLGVHSALAVAAAMGRAVSPFA